MVKWEGAWKSALGCRVRVMPSRVVLVNQVRRGMMATDGGWVVARGEWAVADDDG